MPNFTPRSGEGGWGAARADLTQVGAWDIERAWGAPADLHRLGIPSVVRRLVRWCEADRPGLVLGSAQPATDINDAGVAVMGWQTARRVSGGSAVVVGPGRLVWADVVIPRDDPLWRVDIGQAPLWLGAAWAACLTEAVVHDGPMRKGQWGHLICFAGVGPGEVLVDGRKVVGISQRRTREAALFQCAVLTRWDPEETVAGLAIDDPHQVALDIKDVAQGVDTDGLEARFEKVITNL